MKSRVLSFLVFGCLSFVILQATARADFFIPDPGVLGDKLYNDIAFKDVASMYSFVGAQEPTNPRVDIDTVGNVDSGSGYATIDPIKDGTLTSLIFTPVNPDLFNGFSFRGQLVEAGTITLTVIDNQGNGPQQFFFPIAHANQDFSRIFIASTDETIKSVQIEFADGIKEIKQIQFNSTQPIPGVPEPASLALLGIGLAAMGGYAWSRKRR